MLALNVLSIVLAIPLFFNLALANVHKRNGGLNGKRHVGREESVNGTSLEKRIDGRFSYYVAGLGACGQRNSASDYIVALNSAQFSNNDCFKTITISCNGATAQAQITDECPGCPFGGLDMSEGLFQHFAPLSAGIIHGTWDFGNGPQQPPAHPTHTSTWQPPTSTLKAAKATPSTTSTTSQTSTTTSSASTTTGTTTTTSSTAAAAATAGVIQQAERAMIGLGGMVVAGRG